MYSKREWYTRLAIKALAGLAALTGVGLLAWLATHDWLVSVVSMGLPAEIVLTSFADAPVSYRSYLRSATSPDEALPLA